MRRYSRGSEWRKWDLHVHPPGTKLNNNYSPHFGIDEFVEAIERSDVAVVGVTDYFSVEAFSEVRRRQAALFPESQKILLPNVEIRLNDIVNREDQSVELHVLFRPDVDDATLDRFLRSLKTEIIDGNGRARTCDELTSEADFSTATTTRARLEDAIAETFGADAERQEHVVVLAAVNQGGIRAESGSNRKANIADLIDRLVDGFFGNEANVSWFLKTDRYDDPNVPSKAKPVFSACDAHSEHELNTGLGQTVPGNHTATWIKSDPTFEGLQQTLVEPSERVRIQANAPDRKDAYKVIDTIRFRGSSDFPAEIVLNPNLVSVVGSRSSGKSALLAYVAHSVDAGYTVQQQVDSGLAAKAELAGPAAARTWQAVAHIRCEVAWADGSIGGGNVVYVPQNSLFAISARPAEITAKIEPALERKYPDLADARTAFRADVESCNRTISEQTEEWFGLDAAIDVARARLKTLGDGATVEAAVRALEDEQAQLRAGSKLEEAVLVSYGEYTRRAAELHERKRILEIEIASLGPYIQTAPDSGAFTATERVSIHISSTPAPADLAEPVRSQLARVLEHETKDIRARLSQRLIDRRYEVQKELDQVRDDLETLTTENAEVIRVNDADQELRAIAKRIETQRGALAAIDQQKQTVASLEADRDTRAKAIQDAIVRRTSAIETLVDAFGNETREMDELIFGIEHAVNPAQVTQVSRRVNKKERGSYVTNDGELNIALAQANAGDFLLALSSGRQKLVKGENAQSVSIDALTTSMEIRLYAEMDNDRIGGFAPSSMTPGKQALFALTLILNEERDGWPLLIDQPEDDLDSRSIYDTIVPYLLDRKRERQILMVTHNANLVVGADSEQVLIANRHGDDRKNRNGQTFDYLAGSLEHSQPISPTRQHVLERCGVREHACEILDGGEEAFQKRRDKYGI